MEILDDYLVLLNICPNSSSCHVVDECLALSSYNRIYDGLYSRGTIIVVGFGWVSTLFERFRFGSQAHGMTKP